MANKFDPALEKLKAKIFIETLSRLASNKIPYEYAISKIIWRLSLYLGTGSYIENWKYYPRISDKALEIRSRGSLNWKKELTFEHTEPLNQIYAKFLNSPFEFELNHAAKMICEYLPVIVTRYEERKITEHGFKTEGDPIKRFSHIACSFELKSEPKVTF